MGWSRLDDRYDDHRKIRAATRRYPLAAALHAQAISHCARHESDGLVDVLWIEERASTAVKRTKALTVLEELILFDRLPAGERLTLTDSKRFSVELGPFSIDRHLVHDFLDFNPSSAQLQARREKDARRKAEERGETDDVQHGQGVDTERSPQPVPNSSSPTLVRAPTRTPAGAGWDGLKKEEDAQGEERVARARKPSKRVDPTSLPADFPEALVSVADKVLVALQRLQAERGGDEPTRRGVGLAILRVQNRDHVAVVGDLEHWALAGRGQAKSVKDWVATFRTFLGRAPAGAPSRPASEPRLVGMDPFRKQREREDAIAAQTEGEAA